MATSEWWRAGVPKDSEVRLAAECIYPHPLSTDGIPTLIRVVKTVAFSYISNDLVSPADFFFLDQLTRTQGKHSDAYLKNMSL